MTEVSDWSPAAVALAALGDESHAKVRSVSAVRSHNHSYVVN